MTKKEKSMEDQLNEDKAQEALEAEVASRSRS